MIACAGTVTFLAFSLFFLLALVLMRVGVAGNVSTRPAPARTVIPLARAPRPYDWEREGI